MNTLGTTERRHRRTITSDQEDVLVRGQSESLIREPVCAPGTLSRLQQHQAFAKLPATHQATAPSHPPTAAAAATTVTTARPAWQEPSAQSLGNPSVWNFWSSSTNAG
jgi:hypothetical protein